MIYVESADTTKADELFRALQHAMVDAGMQSDMPHLVADEARFLANKCVSICGPKSKGKLAKKIKGEVASLFSPVEDIPGTPIAHGSGSIEWMNAGHNFIFGLPESHDMRGVGDLYPSYQEFKRQGGKRFLKLRNRGKQSVILIQRLVARKGAVNVLKSRLVGHIGRLKASFGESALKLGQSDLPEWISRHFPTPKSITIKNLESSTPSVTIGSRAPGCEANSELMRRALKSRLNSIKARTRLIISNYARQTAAGIRPSFSAGETYASD